MVSGVLSIRPVKGNIHMLAGKSHRSGHGHHHHWPAMHKKVGFNSSHYISRFSFGEPLPGSTNPLEGFIFTDMGFQRQSYQINVVPTIYYPSVGRHRRHNQYSVSYSKYNVHDGDNNLPGKLIFYPVL
jgi:hypothetical protein